ncbi:response regulator transcription factor [Alteraurantiacibacter buctensis]|uniref:Response regulator n=1 Tax=Alteraurantiacibacter buctensis TaxID=1503981 RepID=A0A844YU71_9SPHN|nr:response regulator [Alteraurantiacibacter buctensis]MXO70044.1 response regulator [Alteraurantiacibacter buctensis]
MTDGPLILIADDEPLLIELLQFRLTGRGYRVAVAQDGREALASIQVQRPAAVVLDAMMPIHDGFEVLRRIRANPDIADIPVIMLTARRSEKDVVGALELGANEYLVKPFIPEELLARLGRLVK